MYLVAIGWIYVVLMMAVAEAMSPQGTVLGALVTFVLYGVLPLSIVLYIMGTPSRRKARRRAEALEDEQRRTAAALAAASAPPDGSGQAPADPITAVRKEA